MLRAIMATLAPACVKPRTIPRPMPPLPPVTSAVFPVNSKGLVIVRPRSLLSSRSLFEILDQKCIRAWQLRIRLIDIYQDMLHAHLLEPFREQETQHG